MSASDVGQVDLTSGMQQRQVGNQALKLFLLVCENLMLFLTLAWWCCGRSTISAEYSLNHRRACSST